MPETKKKKTKIIKQTVVKDGIDTEIEVEVEDVEGPRWLPREAHRVIGKRIPRLDGPDKVTGRAKYSTDMRLPGMLWGRWLGSKYPNARIVNIDLSAAKAMPGVKVAITIEKGGGMARIHGDPIAAVAATTPEIADDALRAIKVEYEEQPHAVTIEQALAPGAPMLSEKGNIASRKQDGDLAAVDAAMGECDHVVELELETQVKPHVCFETHGFIIDYRGGDTATVYASTQGVFTIPGDAAKELGIPEANVLVNTQHMGSGYGSKFGMRTEGVVACRLAKEAKAAVHMMLTRQDEFLATGNRSGTRQKIKAGCKKDGTLWALKGELIKFGGLSGGGPAPQPYVYSAKNVYVDSYAVLTNNDGSRAWRAPRHPQASFAIESIVDELAHASGVDGVAFRKKNLTDPMYHRHLDEGAEAIGWDRRNTTPGGTPGTLKRGMGVAVGTWGGGGRAVCEVDIIIKKDGSVTTRCGTQDLGTGTRTYMAQITAEDLGLEVADIKVEIGMSTYGKANASGGSTTVPSLAPAVKDASAQARAELVNRAAKVLECKPEEVVVRPGRFASPTGKKLDFKQVAALCPPDGLTFRGTWKDTLSSTTTHPVQFAEVEVDTETGKVNVLKVVAVQDCGLCLNELLTESQIEGAVIQSLSYGTLEERVVDPRLGLVLNANMEDYKIAGTTEIPEIVTIIDDKDDRPVIGIGEPPIIPTQSAIANAVYNACGVRITSLPITPDKVLMGLQTLEQEGRRS